jgi:hypothetical protein
MKTIAMKHVAVLTIEGQVTLVATPWKGKVKKYTRIVDNRSVGSQMAKSITRDHKGKIVLNDKWIAA